MKEQWDKLREWCKTYPVNHISFINDTGRDDGIIQGIVFLPMPGAPIPSPKPGEEMQAFWIPL